MKKILLVNFIIIIILLFCLEFFFVIMAANYRFNTVKDENILKRFKQDSVVKFILDSYFKPVYYAYETGSKNLRPVMGGEYNSRPILLFGCSVAYGNYLDDDKNFSGILSKIAKRPVYNIAFNGWSPAHMLKSLRENKNLLFVQNPEYIIYTYIKDQKRRLFFYQGWRYSSQLYKLYDLVKNGNLIEYSYKYPFYWKLMTTKHIQYALERFYYQNEEKADKLLFKIFEESVSIIKKRYPNSKLVLLLYDVKMCKNNENAEIFKTEDVLSILEQEKFKEMGFEIINMEELVAKSFCGEDYHVKCPIYGDVDPHHPSSKMWEEFVPKLVEKLKM